MNKTKKVMAGISATALMMGIAGCNNQQGYPESEWDQEGSELDEQEWSASDEQDIPPIPEGTNCSEWEWDAEDGVWECEDTNSPYFGHYFFAGMFFANRSLLYKSSDYMNYKKSPSFKGARLDSKYKNTTPSGSSGFGSGSRSTTGG